MQSVYFAGVLQVSGIRVYTSGEMEAVNGTDARLKCSFQTSAPINVNTLTISWTFRPLGPGREESVSVCVCVFGRKCDQTSNLPHCVREYPPPQSTERAAGESSGSLWSIQDSCASETLCVCVHIENRMRSMQQVGVTVLASFSLRE